MFIKRDFVILESSDSDLKYFLKKTLIEDKITLETEHIFLELSIWRTLEGGTIKKH